MGQDAKNAGRVECNFIGKGRARRKGENVGEEELAGRPNHTCLIKLSYTDPPVGGAASHSEVKKGRMVGTRGGHRHLQIGRMLDIDLI